LRDTARIIYRWHFTNHDDGERDWAIRYIRQLVGKTSDRFGSFTEGDVTVIEAEWEPEQALDAAALHQWVKDAYPNGCNGLTTCRCSACQITALAHGIDDADVFIHVFLNESTGMQLWSFWCYPELHINKKPKKNDCKCLGCVRDRMAARHIERYGGYRRQYPDVVIQESVRQLSFSQLLDRANPL